MTANAAAVQYSDRNTAAPVMLCHRYGAPRASAALTAHTNPTHAAAENATGSNSPSRTLAPIAPVLNAERVVRSAATA